MMMDNCVLFIAEGADSMMSSPLSSYYGSRERIQPQQQGRIEGRCTCCPYGNHKVSVIPGSEKSVSRIFD